MAQDSLDEAKQQADKIFPLLQKYAPDVGVETLEHRPDVAGRYDPNTKRVLLNTAASLKMNKDQLAGLISLERSRGLLASPEGKQFLDKLNLTKEQSDFWNKFYLREGVDAPQDKIERQNILKGTILSRLLVGDTMPQGAPSLTKSQQEVGENLQTHARGQSSRLGYGKSKADQQFDAYMSTVRKYLDDVKADKRSFRQLDVYAPRFSQGRDEGLPFRNPPTTQAYRQGSPSDTQFKPVWGFHEPTVTAAEGVSNAVRATPDVLADPRNAWMGLGPLSTIGRWKRGWEVGRELGGFSPPIGHLPDMANIERYNKGAEILSSRDPMEHLIGHEMLSRQPQEERQRLMDTVLGHIRLKTQRDAAMRPSEGGGVPPQSVMELLKKKFGFGE